MNNTSRTETISGTFTMNKKRLALLGVAALMALGLAAQNDSTLFMQQLCALEGISDVKPLETSTFKEK